MTVKIDSKEKTVEMVNIIRDDSAMNFILILKEKGPTNWFSSEAEFKAYLDGYITRPQECYLCCFSI